MITSCLHKKHLTIENLLVGVLKLKHSKLEVACEDFSDIIGTSSEGIVYKGTLSSGVEIAVTSAAVTSVKDWSKHLEATFRKKIEGGETNGNDAHDGDEPMLDVSKTSQSRKKRKPRLNLPGMGSG